MFLKKTNWFLKHKNTNEIWRRKRDKDKIIFNWVVFLEKKKIHLRCDNCNKLRRKKKHWVPSWILVILNYGGGVIGFNGILTFFLLCFFLSPTLNIRLNLLTFMEQLFIKILNIRVLSRNVKWFTDVPS